MFKVLKGSTRRMLQVRALAGTVMLISLAGCASTAGGPTGTQNAVAVTAEPTAPAAMPPEPSPEVLIPEEPFPGDGPWTVSFVTADGINLQGTLHGKGATGVVLAPMYLEGQAGWLSFAQMAALQNLRVLTFDLRGYGQSEGVRDAAQAPVDIAAALSFMEQNGTSPQVLIGAGLGGTGAIRVAAQDPAIAGLVVISAPRAFGGLELTDSELASLDMPTLWLGARNDLTHNVEEMYALARSSDKELWLYEGSSLQGTFILQGIDGPDLQSRLLAFIARVSSP